MHYNGVSIFCWGHIEVSRQYAIDVTRRIFCIILILLVSHLSIIEPASAQFVPAVNLECQSVHSSGNLELNVSNNSSGNVSDYAECTVSNPNVYQEKIRILIMSGPLNQEGPADFYVEAGSEVDFQVKVWVTNGGEGGWENQTMELTIIAEVVEANGLPPPIYTSSESELLVDIIVYEESNETGMIISDKSDDDQSLIYAGGGGAVLLLLILFIYIKRRKQDKSNLVEVVQSVEDSIV